MDAGDIATWLGVIAAIGGLIFAIWKFMDYKITSSEMRVGGKADRALSKAETVQTELAAHRLHVAEQYATKQGVTEQISSLAIEIKDGFKHVDGRFDAMTERLDRVIEASHRPIKRHPQE